MASVFRKPQGFTLIEVMVALMVIAVAMSAIVSALGQSVKTAGGLQERTFAHWVAMNKMAELHIASSTYPDLRKTRGSSLMAGHEWYWAQDVQKTPDGSDFLRKVIIEVRALENDEFPLVTLTGFVGKPMQ